MDLFLLESGEVDDRAMLRQLAEVGLLLGREVNTIRYTEEGVAGRLGWRFPRFKPSPNELS